jgi:hypothetical protein
MLARDDGCCQNLMVFIFQEKKDGCYAKTLDDRLQMPLSLPAIGVDGAWK